MRKMSNIDAGGHASGQTTAHGWLCELVHEKTGEVIRSVFSADSPLEGRDKVKGFRWRSIEMAQASHPADTQRLDWLMLHQSAELGRDGSGPYITAYLTSGDRFSDGVSGHYLSRGATHRACIDAFLRGECSLID